MKRVGGDSGQYEREEFVDAVMLAPSERAVVDVMFDTPGHATLEHRTPERVEALVQVTVGDERAQPSLEDSFASQRISAEMVAERQRVAPYLAAAPDKTVAFIAEMDVPAAEGAAVYVRPMHPEVVSDHPDHCPRCGMKLMPRSDAKPSGHGHDHGAHHGYGAAEQHHGEAQGHGEGHGHGSTEHHHGEGEGHSDGHAESHGHGEGHGHGATAHDQDEGHGHSEGHGHGTSDGIEWEDDMVDVNRGTTRDNMRWKIVDRSTGAENHAIDWRFRVGDQVQIPRERDDVRVPRRAVARRSAARRDGAAEQQDGDEHPERDVDRPAERRPEHRHARVRDQRGMHEEVEQAVTRDPGRDPPLFGA
jgi:hypothetical protein